MYDAAKVEHYAVLRGYNLVKGVLICMNAVIIDDGYIGVSAFIAPLAFVKEKFSVSTRSIVVEMQARQSLRGTMKNYYERISVMRIIKIISSLARVS